MDKEREITEEELRQILKEPFYSLIFSLFNSAMISLGKLPNPMTDKVEVDLDQAQVTIEMLSMLKDKTNGNLNDQEQLFLDTQLSELRFVFAEKVKQTSPPK
ncbi:DUF1844 domain-containing protein [bacterium]|nr:DUF1844 domain-containing protein [bacterium]